MKYFITLILFTFLLSTARGQEMVPKEQSDLHAIEKPQYPGGEKGLQEYLTLNLHYPNEAMASKVEGEVLVSFEIGNDGVIRNVKTIKNIGFGCDEEAVRVVRLMPRWQPALKNGKAIAVNYRLPVIFELPAPDQKYPCLL